MKLIVIEGGKSKEKDFKRTLQGQKNTRYDANGRIGKFIADAKSYMEKGINYKEAGADKMAAICFETGEKTVNKAQLLFKDNPELASLYFKFYFHMGFHELCLDIDYNSQNNSFFCEDQTVSELKGLIKKSPNPILDIVKEIGNPDRNYQHHWFTHLKRGMNLIAFKNYSNALESLLKAKELNPKSELVDFKIAECKFLTWYGAIEKDDEAIDQNIDYYKESVESFFSLVKNGYVNPDLYNYSGVILYMQHDYDKAIKYFEETTVLNPCHIDGWINSFHTYFQLGDDANSQRCLSIAELIDSSNPSLLKIKEEIKPNVQYS